MKTTRNACTRRRFLGAATAATTAASLGRWPLPLAAAEKPKRRKTILSFYLDDTQPYRAGVEGFQKFLDYCQSHGVRGESSLSLGMGGRGSITRLADAKEKAYLEQIRRAWDCGIDTHAEFMTHGGLFDFEANASVPTPCKGWNPEKLTGICEWLFVQQPDISVEQYERYFGNILTEGARAGARFTGITWPGSSCEACRKRYAEFRAAGLKPKTRNPNLWKALLNLAKAGKFRGPVVTCFFDYGEKDSGCHCMASDGEYAVYDLMPNAGRDFFGSYTNKEEEADADYYVTADGKSGLIPRCIEAGEPYCVWYCHWQGLNPVNGVGWKVFTALVERVEEHFKDRVVWMRPSDITAAYHKAGGWGFLDALG